MVKKSKKKSLRCGLSQITRHRLSGAILHLSVDPRASGGPGESPRELAFGEQGRVKRYTKSFRCR